MYKWLVVILVGCSSVSVDKHALERQIYIDGCSQGIVSILLSQGIKREMLPIRHIVEFCSERATDFFNRPKT